MTFFRTTYTFVGYYFTLLMFGLFGLVLSIAAWLAGAFPQSDTTEQLFQRLVHGSFALFIWWTTFARLFRVRYHGFEHLPQDHRQGLVVAANHPGLTDITCLLARLPRAVCIFKRDIRRNPVLGAGARRAGYLANDGGHEMIRTTADKVRSGRTLIVFPEGTRTPPTVRLLPFKPGFLLIARRAQAPLQLVRIVNSRPVLAKGRAWWKFPPLPATADIFVGPRVMLSADGDLHQIRAQVEAWFRARSSTEEAACAASLASLCSPAAPTTVPS